MKDRKKVIARIFGGIGNQLFCYAAARRVALKNNAELVIDNVSGFTHEDNYPRDYQLNNFSIKSRIATPIERMEPFPRFRRYVCRKYNSLIPFNTRGYIKERYLEFDERLLDLTLSRDLYLDGYWQSEEYFCDIDDIIRQDLKIKPPIDNINIELSRFIESKLSVAVHVRFFDSIHINSTSNISDGYYEKAIMQMETLVPGAHYFLFSDYPELARLRILLPDNRITCVVNNKGDQNAYADLWLMTKCKHFIIANSTFSWWGAWLGPDSEKKVIAPGCIIEGYEQVSAWGFDRLLPNKWMKI